MSTAVDRPQLRFHRLSVMEEDGEVVVGRADIDSYCQLPADGAALLRELQAGRGPDDAAAWYEATYGERVDVEEFVAALRDLGFIRNAGEQCAEAPEPVRWQRLGRALFSPLAWVCHAAVVAAALVVCFTETGMMPRPQNVFFVDSLVVVELTIFGGQLILALFHELFHVLAARRLGLRSTVRLGRRLHFVVFETVLDGLVAVPRRKRYLPILAGLLADVLAVAALTLAAYGTRGADGEVSLFGGVCLALAFTTLPRMAWQFYFYLRTDVYYLVTTVLRCADLQATAQGLLRNKLNAVLRRPERLLDEDQWHPRDRKLARWYAPLLVSGYAASTVVLIVIVLPVAWRFVESAAGRVFGGDAGTAEFWDSAVILALTVSQLVIAGVLAVRELRQRRRPVG